jgi:hypothetical protein
MIFIVDFKNIIFEMIIDELSVSLLLKKLFLSTIKQNIRSTSILISDSIKNKWRYLKSNIVSFIRHLVQ